MATTTNVSPLKINYLTQAQYDTALANNQINANELYFTPSSGASAGNVIGSSTAAKFYRGDNTWSNEISGGQLKITANSNTVTIGSQNASFCHIYNSTAIPFIFNNSVATTNGDLGTSTYRWGTGYFKGDIILQGTGTTTNNRIYCYRGGTGAAEGFIGYSVDGNYFGIYDARISKYLVSINTTNDKILYADAYNGSSTALAYS